MEAGWINSLEVWLGREMSDRRVNWLSGLVDG